MKLILALTFFFIASTSYSQEMVFKVQRIDTLLPARVEFQTVKILIGERVTQQAGDTTQQIVNVTTHAIDTLDGKDYAIVVRHHQIPASVYDNAFDGFDTKTGLPKLKLVILASLLAPYNLKLKQ